MKKTMRKCVVCDKKFAPKTANSVTCSEKCRKARKAATDKARKAAKKAAKVKPEAKKEAKKPVVKKAEKRATTKSVKGKATEKIKLHKECDTLLSIRGCDDFKIVTLAFIAALSAIGRMIKANKIKGL